MVNVADAPTAKLPTSQIDMAGVYAPWDALCPRWDLLSGIVTLTDALDAAVGPIFETVTTKDWVSPFAVVRVIGLIATLRSVETP